jgi:hypothetical protein
MKDKLLVLGIPLLILLGALIISGCIGGPAPQESKDTTPPEAITGLTTVDAKDGKINLSWTASTASDFSEYRIYKNTSQFTDITNAELVTRVMTITTTTYQVTWLQNDVMYYFTVVAVDKSGNLNKTVISVGAKSTSSIILIQNHPPTITNITSNATIVYCGEQVNILIIASDLDNNTLTYSYFATDGVVSGNGSNVSWTAPTTNGTYTINVTVSDGNLTATSSINITVINVTSQPPISSVPSISSITTISYTDIDGSYNINWTSSTYAEKYMLEENGVEIYNGTALTYSLLSKQDGTYVYRVKARSTNGTSNWSAPVTIKVDNAKQPGTSTITTIAYTDTDGAYNVNWTTSAYASKYVFEENGIEIYNGTSTTYAITGKTDGIYSYKIRAWNTNGTSNWSSSVMIIVDNAKSPGTPSITTTTYTDTDGTYSINWTTSAYATKYILEENNIQIYNGTNTTQSFTGKSDGTYTYRVKAWNTNTTSNWASTVTITVRNTISGVLMYDNTGSNYKNRINSNEAILVTNITTGANIETKRINFSSNAPKTIAGMFDITSLSNGTYRLNQYTPNATVEVPVNTFIQNKTSYLGKNVKITGVNAVGLVYANHTFGFNTDPLNPFVFVSMDKTPLFFTNVSLIGTVMPENILNLTSLIDINFGTDLSNLTKINTEATQRLWNLSGIGNHFVMIDSIEYDATKFVEADALDILTTDDFIKLGQNILGNASSNGSQFLFSMIKNIDENLVMLAERDNIVKNATFWFVLTTKAITRDKLNGIVTLNISEADFTGILNKIGVSFNVPSDFPIKFKIGVCKDVNPINQEPYTKVNVYDLWAITSQNNTHTVEKSVELNAFAYVMDANGTLKLIQEKLNYTSPEAANSISQLRKLCEIRNPAFALIIDENFSKVFETKGIDFWNYSALAMIPNFPLNQSVMHYINLKGVVYDSWGFLAINTTLGLRSIPLIIADNVTEATGQKICTLQDIKDRPEQTLRKDSITTNIQTEGFMTGTTAKDVGEWMANVLRTVGKLSNQKQIETIGNVVDNVTKYMPVDVCFYELSNFTYNASSGNLSTYKVPVVYLYPISKGPIYIGKPVTIKGIYVNATRARDVLLNTTYDLMNTLGLETALGNVSQDVNQSVLLFDMLERLIGNISRIYQLDGFILAYEINEKPTLLNTTLQELKENYTTIIGNNFLTPIITQGFITGSTVKNITKTVGSGTTAEDIVNLSPFDVGVYLLTNVTINPNNITFYQVPAIYVGKDVGQMYLKNFTLVKGVYIDCSKGYDKVNATLNKTLGKSANNLNTLLSFVNDWLAFGNASFKPLSGFIYITSITPMPVPQIIPMPSSPTPTNGSSYTTLSFPTQLSWQQCGPKLGFVWYNVTYEISDSTPDMFGILPPALTWENFIPILSAGYGTYYWQVTAYDIFHLFPETKGPVWRFTYSV